MRGTTGGGSGAGISLERPAGPRPAPRIRDDLARGFRAGVLAGGIEQRTDQKGAAGRPQDANRVTGEVGDAETARAVHRQAHWLVD